MYTYQLGGKVTVTSKNLVFTVNTTESGRKWPGYNWSQRTLLQMLSFKPAFSFSSFSFIKRIFSSSLLSAIMVVSSEYLRLLIFLLEILIPDCAQSSPAFCMMYSAYELNKQGDNVHHWCTNFPVWNQSVFPCPVLTITSWPAYRFLRRQVRWSGIPISLQIYKIQCYLPLPHILPMSLKLAFLQLSSFLQVFNLWLLSHSWGKPI